MFGGEHEATEGLRARVARGRPNWWVILAVSLGLMALLVATAGGTPPAPRRDTHAADASSRERPSAPHKGLTAPTVSTTTTAPAPATPAPSTSPGAAATVASRGTTLTPHSVIPSQAAAVPSVTTSTVPPATTTTTSTPVAAVPADRTETQGYLNPPLQTSSKFGFTGSGAMEVSVVWSGSTYLSLAVTCPSGDQSGGGTSAMAVSLPDASGSCLATVSEPATESATVTFTITIGPSGG